MNLDWYSRVLEKWSSLNIFGSFSQLLLIISLSQTSLVLFKNIFEIPPSLNHFVDNDKGMQI